MWGDFQDEKKRYMDAWESMKAPYAGAIRCYLDQSRIIVSAGREFEIDDDLVAAFAACPAFFIIDSLKRTEALDPAGINITDNWRIKVKFPYVDIDFIQELKSSPYCDRNKTLLRPSSTDVVLLPVDEQETI